MVDVRMVSSARSGDARSADDGKPRLPALDASQGRAATGSGQVRVVVGSPGTGRSTVAAAAVLHALRTEGLRPDQTLLLAPTRVAADRLRDVVSAELEGAWTQAPARSHQSLGFSILRDAAAAEGLPTPRLISGAEQDVVLREVLAGHASGEVEGPSWPAELADALAARGFRAELRDLLMRAVENDLDAEGLAAVGREHGRGEWIAAAQVMEEYQQVTALARPGTFDAAEVLVAARRVLEEDEAAVERWARSLRLVVVDDAQELTRPAADLLRTLVERVGARLVMIGDPDVTVQGFRGAQPGLFLDLGARLGAGAPAVLEVQHRTTRAVQDVVDRVTSRVGVTQTQAHRSVAGARDGGSVAVDILRSSAQEASHVAAVLRRRHFADGVPWDRMAVIVRGRSWVAALVRALGESGVPAATSAAPRPLRDVPAARMLLDVLDLVLAVAKGRGAAVPVDDVIQVLTSPIGGADAIEVRRVRRALRREATASTSGGDDDGDPTAEFLTDPLVRAVTMPGATVLMDPELESVRRLAHAVEAGVAAAVRDGGRWARGVSGHQVLWAVWDACGLAQRWRGQALNGGRRGLRADRDLDAVVALMDAAEAFEDRLPGAGPEEFLRHMREQVIGADSLSEAAPAGGAVEVLTAQGAAGRDWEVVAICGMQEGVWPDTRLRGSVLGSEDLVDILHDRPRDARSAQRAVLNDELRQFVTAVSRARTHLLVTAVSSDEDQPSDVVRLVDPDALAEGAWPVREPEEATTLRALVARARRDLLNNTGVERDRARAALRRLADAGAPGADPSTWWAAKTPTTRGRLVPEGQPVRLSPSQVESFMDCRLRWLLQRSGGEREAKDAATVGTLVHDVLAEKPRGTLDELERAVDARWSDAGYGPGWSDRRERQRVSTMLEKYVALRDEPSKRQRDARGGETYALVAVEQDVVLKATVPGDDGDQPVVVTARVDRVERDGRGRLQVVDIKTGAVLPSQGEVARHPQLGIYQYLVDQGALAEALSEAGIGGSVHEPAQSGGAALMGLGGAAQSAAVRAQKPLADDEDPAWAAALVATTAAGMASGQIAATPGDQCRTCPVAACCPAQDSGKETV